MKDRSQGFIAAALVTLVVAAATAADRVGVATPPPAPPASARSSEWLCPHGGGDGWTAQVVITNPGRKPVEARFTSMGSGAKPGSPSTVTVAAGSQLRREVPAGSPASATYVEVFGGWAAASWLLRAADPAVGLGAEPCAPAGAERWITAESTTQQHEAAYLIVMNPYAAGAVFDVVLYQPDEPPLRDADWSDLELRPGRVLALRIDAKVAGKDAVAAVVDAQSGRVAVSTLGVTDGGGVRSVLGATAEGATSSLGTQWGTGQSQVLVFVPGEDAVRLGATMRSTRPPQAAGGLVDVRQTSVSTQGYPVIAEGPSLVELVAALDADVVAAIRSSGQGADDAATGGLVTPSVAWVVPPTSLGEPAFPGLIVANPGEAAVEVTLQLVGVDGLGATVAVSIPPAGAAEVDPSFLGSDPTASILVRAESPVFAAGASTSAGKLGVAFYAIASGMPIPGWAAAA